MREDETDESWDPDALARTLDESMKLEEMTHPGEAYHDRSQRLLTENAPRAALAIVNLAMYARNETTRLKAASYVIDRALGRIPVPKQDIDTFDWEKTLAGLGISE
jgi:hypothetical protein